MPTRYVLGWRLIWGVTLHQLLRYVFVEDFLHGQGDDDFVAALEERFDLLQGVRRIIERHEEAFLAILAHHHGFKGVYVRAADLVFLFYLGCENSPAIYGWEYCNPIFRVPSGTAEHFLSSLTGLVTLPDREP